MWAIRHIELKNGQHVLEHMGTHILHDSRLNGSEECCGLCLYPTSICQLYLQKAHGITGSVLVDHKKSSCMNLIYSTASILSEASPCSNIPVTCPLCPNNSPATWTYSLHAHFQGQHHLQYPAHFPIKVGLSQSEKNGM